MHEFVIEAGHVRVGDELVVIVLIVLDKEWSLRSRQMTERRIHHFINPGLINLVAGADHAMALIFRDLILRDRVFEGDINHENGFQFASGEK